MTTFEAIQTIVRDAYNQKRRTDKDYRRVCRALHSLTLSPAEIESLLRQLEYHNDSGTAYEWTRAATAPSRSP